MHTSCRTLLFLIFSALCTSAPAAASQILFFAPQLPCSGVPLTCFPGGLGLPVLHPGPLYVPITLPANSLIEEIDLWGDSATPVGIWDSAIQLPPLIPSPFPDEEIVGFGPGDLDDTFMFFATDGINGAPYYELHYQLHDPFLVTAGGLYYVGVSHLAMVGASNAIFLTNAFTSPASNLSTSLIPGVAIRVVGQVVPEPSTLVLMLSGAALLWRRSRARSRRI